MSDSEKFNNNRREFLKKSVSLGFGLYGMTRLGLASSTAKTPNPKAKVVIAHSDDIINNAGKVVETVVERLLDKAIMNLAGVDNQKKAWGQYFTPKDVVGVKINTLAGRRMSSHVELVNAIIRGLKAAGVLEKNIILWDKSDGDLEGAGFEINTSRTEVKCLSTESTVGYGDLIMYGSIASCYSRILNACTALLNVPVLKHHSMAGVTISLKNWLGAVHNPNKYHIDAAADPYIADINMPDILQKKRQLIICDAILAQYAGGPSFNPKYTWKCNSLLVSTDPVALDAVGAQMIEAKRKEMQLPSLSKAGIEPKYIAIAADAEHQLGTNDLKKIQIVRIKG